MNQHVNMLCVAGLCGLAALPARSLAQGGTSVHVCVGVDHVLRYVPGTACPAGQASYSLALDGTQPTPPDEDKSVSNEIGQLKKTIDFLRDRVSNLESELGKQGDKKESDVSHIVQAPFHVVDKSGKPIFTVTDGAVKQAVGRIRIGRGSGDNYGVSVANAAGTLVAALTEASNGAGGFGVYDQAGNRSVQVIAGQGVRLYGPSDKEVVSIGFNGAHPDRGVLQISGLLQVFNAAGETVVEAGSNSNGVGVVRVGPGAKCVPMGTLRLPDCIMGRKQ
jgi:hypothetical protein